MKKKMLTLCLLALLANHSCVLAQDFALKWYALSGGAGVCTGGVYSVSGTVGQPVVGPSSGGDYTLEGGYWSVVAVVPTPGAPELKAVRSGQGVLISWPSTSPGFVLEEAISLPPPNGWGVINQAVIVIGGENTVTIPAVSGNRFYRLRKP